MTTIHLAESCGKRLDEGLIAEYDETGEVVLQEIVAQIDRFPDTRLTNYQYTAHILSFVNHEC
jgi:hypothetical protein